MAGHSLSRSTGWFGLILLILLIMLAACGVQDDGRPRALRDADVPFDLLAEAPAATAETGPGAGARVWFVDNDGQLARGSGRQIEPPITVAAVVRALLEGVTESEADAGLRSNIVPGTELHGVVGPVNGLVTIDLSAEFLTVSRDLQRLALAQVVFTATGLPNVDRVLFKVDGKSLEVPGAGEELTDAPLTRDDFAQFDPSRTTTTVRP